MARISYHREPSRHRQPSRRGLRAERRSAQRNASTDNKTTRAKSKRLKPNATKGLNKDVTSEQLAKRGHDGNQTQNVTQPINKNQTTKQMSPKMPKPIVLVERLRFMVGPERGTCGPILRHSGLRRCVLRCPACGATICATSCGS